MPSIFSSPGVYFDGDTTPQHRIDVGIADCYRKLSNPYLTDQARTNLALQYHNLNELRRTFSPEYIAEVRAHLELSRDPSREEVLMYFIEQKDAEKRVWVQDLFAHTSAS